MQFLLFFLGFFSISQLGFHLWPSWSRPLGIPVDYLSLTIYFTDLLLLLLLAANLKRLLSWLKSHSLFLTFPILNILLSISLPLTTFSWLRLLLLVNLVLFVSNLHPPKIRSLVSGLCLAIFFSIFLAFLQFILQRSLGGPFYWLGERSFGLNTYGIAKFDPSILLPCTLSSILCSPILRPYATFSHPNSLAGFLLVSSLIIFHFRHFLSRYLIATLLLLTPLSLILIFSRVVLLCLGLILIIVFVNRIRISRRLLFYLLLLTLPILVISYLFPSAFPKAISERLLLNRFSLKVISSYPIFGTGLGGYLLAQTQLGQGISLNHFFLLLQPVHNAFLLIISELGIPLSLAALQTLARLQIPRIAAFPLLALLTVFLTSLFDHYWLTLPQNRLLLAILLGIIFNPRLQELKLIIKK